MGDLGIDQVLVNSVDIDRLKLSVDAFADSVDSGHADGLLDKIKGIFS